MGAQDENKHRARNTPHHRAVIDRHLLEEYNQKIPVNQIYTKCKARKSEQQAFGLFADLVFCKKISEKDKHCNSLDKCWEIAVSLKQPDNRCLLGRSDKRSEIMDKPPGNSADINNSPLSGCKFCSAEIIPCQDIEKRASGNIQP